MKAFETFLAFIVGLLVAGIVIAIILAVFYAVCNWRIYRKLGLPGWVSLVPFYNFLMLGEVLGLGKFPIVQCVAFGLSFVPYIGPVFTIVSTILHFIVQYYIIVSLGRPSWFILLAIFTPVIYYPILAFSDG